MFICSLEINPHTAIKFTHFVTPGVAPTVQALHLFKLFMMLLLPTLGKPKKNNLFN